MTVENYDFFCLTIFKKGIRIISRVIFGAKFYLIKNCPILLKLSHILPDTLFKKCQSLNQIEELFTK